MTGRSAIAFSCERRSVVRFCCCLCVAFLSIFTVLISATYAAGISAGYRLDEPFSSPSNSGGTGLLEVPTARVIRPDSFRIGAGQAHPYRNYYGVISPFRGLEIEGRIIEIIDVEVTKSDIWKQYGNYKDKSVSLKYQALPEGKYSPAVAVGIMDPHGTRLYSAQYVAMSKQIYPFDFTLGFGNGRYGKRQLPSSGDSFRIEMLQKPRTWLKDGQFFWGLQFSPSPKYSFMVEYSSVRYEAQTSDPAQKKYFQSPAPSHYNFGFRWKPFNWADAIFSYQRGETFGINLSFDFDIGNPLIPIYDQPYREAESMRASPDAERLTEAFFRSGFSDIGIVDSGDALRVEVQNDRYFYAPRALRVVMDIVSAVSPERISAVTIVLKENGIPLMEFSALRSDFAEYASERLTSAELFRLSSIEVDRIGVSAARTRHRRTVSYGVKHSFQTFLNDPTGFFKYRLGLSGWGIVPLWSGGVFVAGLEYYPINNVSTSNEPLSIPVRTDIALYKREKVALSRMLFEQISKHGNGIHTKLTGGLLETQYAGIDVEVAGSLLDGRLMIGAGGSLSKKRDPDNQFELKRNDVKDYHSTAFLNARYTWPESGFFADLKAGRFLAGDTGTRLSLSKFINGVVISAWYSYTDTSVFRDAFNKGYHDKGIAVSVPIRLFLGRDSKTSYSYALAPWTRDVAQDIDHYTTLFDYMARNTKSFIRAHRQEFE